VDPKNPHLEGHYWPWRAYGQAKLANFHFGLGLDRLLREESAPAASLVAHPGLSNTERQAVSVEETGGGLSQRFFHGLARFVNNDPVRKPIMRRLGMKRAIDRLWEVSERETGVRVGGTGLEPVTPSL
jgi:hypothetical protein